MKKVLLMLCLFLSTTVYAKITATLAPNPVKQGDAVELILSSESAFSGVPNIDILQKDFVIGGQQKRQSSQWINGKGKNTHQLIYTLFPNKSGTLTVHGLKVGNEVISDLTLNVSADANYETKGEIVVSVDCPKANIYPGQKMLCAVFLEDSIGLVDGEITAPQSQQGTWEQILPPVPVAASTPGTRKYQSAFAFTPNESGTLQMSPFIFQGAARLKTNAKPRGIMDFMLMSLQSSATQPVGAQSKPFTIAVKQKPVDYEGWWLPSSHVTLTESYQLPETIAIGEPITRTLVLTAQDVMADNMPVPESSSTDKFKVYANPAERNDTTEGGQVTVTMNFVPTQSGEIVLPAIHVPWFDPIHEKIESASVPERKIIVAADTVSEISTPKFNPKSEPETKELPSSQPAPASIPTQVPQPLPWLWIVLATSLAFILGIVIAVLILKHSSSAERKKKKPLPDLYPF